MSLQQSSSNEFSSTQNPTCSNCGTSGHGFRHCTEPVSSYGVLVFRWTGKTEEWSPTKEFCSDTRSPTGLIQTQPEVLMIQRKDSLGFMDILRGKYKINDPDYIRKQLRGTTKKERNSLLNDEFDTIWQNLWGSDAESSQRYAHDRHTSKQKLLELRKGIETNKGETYTLADLLRQEPVVYETPEWGFPKGRRNPYETDLQCAYRELEEETSIHEEELWKVMNIAPFVETFYGSNDIHYRHTYYIAQYIGDRTISFDALNNEMTKEIGSLAWKSMDDALLLLRPDNLEKRGILIQLATLFRNFVPIFREDLVGIPSIQDLSGNDSVIVPNQNTRREQQDLYVYRSQTQRTRSISGRMERTRRFFGERQTHRRISDLRGGQAGGHSEEDSRNPGPAASTTASGSASASTTGSRGRGRFVSGYRRQAISYETSGKEGDSGEPSTKTDE
jgi:8-oxo-dGTP pyrophosphatase MutT (NUDIX family)